MRVGILAFTLVPGISRAMSRAVRGTRATVETQLIQLFIFVVFFPALAVRPLAEAARSGAVDRSFVLLRPFLRNKFIGSHLETGPPSTQASQVRLAAHLNLRNLQ